MSDNRLYREGLAEILGSVETLSVVGAASDVAGARTDAHRLAPDVILVDVALPGGVDAARELHAVADEAKVVVLGIQDEEREVVACAEAGASGYVTRDASLAELVETVASVGRGELRCPPGVAGSLLRRVADLAARERRARPDPRDALTRREREVAELIEEGLSNKEIARRLQIELPTVKNHVHRILEKLGARRRSEAAARLGGRTGD